MAVISMQKIRILAHHDVASGVIESVQKQGVLELTEITDETLSNRDKKVFEFNYVSSRLDFAVNFLSQYAPKRGLLKKLVEGNIIDVEERECENILHSYPFNEIVDEASNIQEDIQKTSQKLIQLKDEKELLAEWVNFDIPLGAGFSTENTDTIFLEIKKKEDKKAKGLHEVFKEAGMLFHSTEVSDDKYSLTFLVEDRATVEKIVRANDYTVVDLPKRRGTPNEELERMDRAIVKVGTEHDGLVDKAKLFAIENLEKLKILSDYLSWKKEKHNVLEMALGTKDTLVFEGWCPKGSVISLQGELKKGTDLVDLHEIEAGEDEEPPVEIVNKGIIQPFESITRLYGLPGHRDIDPTIFLAGFFFLFFGMSLTDVGYGLFLALTTWAALTFFKIPKGAKPLIRLLMLGGIASTLVGLLFGGYLGITMESMPKWLQALQKFDPIANPLPVFYTALGLGVFQVMFGISLRIFSEYRNNNFYGGLFDHGPWLLLFIAFMIFGAEKIGFIAMSTSIFVYLALALIMISNARHGKTILQKVSKGLLALYDIIGYFSDVLSYSRLLALGLATSALAFAVNLIAGIIGDMVPVVGPVIAVLILIGGHLFNLAVNTLGAFIHSARLQFVEFFGKFITGTGRIFKPFKREERYISIID